MHYMYLPKELFTRERERERESLSLSLFVYLCGSCLMFEQFAYTKFEVTETMIILVCPLMSLNVILHKQ